MLIYLYSMGVLLYFVVFVAVAISFGQSSYFASEAQRFMNITLVSSVPVDFPYDIVIVTILSNPVSAAGKTTITYSKTWHCVFDIYFSDGHEYT